MSEVWENSATGSRISAKRILLGENIAIGRNVHIATHGDFSLGSHSRLGDNTVIEGNNISIGEHFYGSGGMVIGAGGQQYPDANLTMGARCVVHSNTINLCEPVTIGDDVGFSGRVEVVTHGFWLSVLEGHPSTFGPVKIGNGVILGFGSTLLMGADIADNVVLGAHSVVTGRLANPNSIYVGAPAKFLRAIVPPSCEQRVAKMEEMIAKYRRIAKYQGFQPNIRLLYPYIEVNEFRLNVETFEYEGLEDEMTDNFRDFARKWGIRIYTPRGFRTHFEFGKGFVGPGGDHALGAE